MTAIKPLNIKVHLASNPQNTPQYAVPVKNNKGEEETLADPRATRALVALMNQHAVTGGAAAHWGGPAAFAEIMSSVHALMFRQTPWYNSFHFVNDAGHTENGVYALRANYGFDQMDLDTLKGFRSIESKLTGHGEVHVNPQGVYISNGPLGSGLPQAQGLAIADKLTGKKRTTICTISDGASMEGEAKESFAAIPGLAAKGKLNPFVLLISDNNTKLSGRIDQDSFDMNPTFESLATLGWDLQVIPKGNDLQSVHLAVEKALEKAEANPKKPVAVVFKTVKGFGVKSTEESASGGHGYPIKPYDSKLVEFIQEIYSGDAPELFTKWAKDVVSNKPSESSKPASANAVKKGKVQPGFARAAIKAAQEGLPVFSVSSDLQGSTGIAPFHKEFPSLSLDIGIAEANMVSTAVGLSKEGFIPIVDTFAQFGITKGNLPLIMAGLAQAPIMAIFSHTGFQDAADGASHQATTYLAATSALPYTQTIVCSCAAEAEAYFYHALKDFAAQREKGETPDSKLFFLGRENFPEYYAENLDYTWGKAQVLTEGKDGVIVTCGPQVPKALLAYEALKAEGKEVTVINNPFANRPDTATVAAALNKANGKLITVEDHQIIGGMGAQLAHALLQEGVSFEYRGLGIEGKFGQSAYQADQLYSLHKIDDQAVIELAKKFL
jgi:transketolase